MKSIIQAGIPTILITTTRTLDTLTGAPCTITFHGTDTAMDAYFVDMICNLICLAHRAKYLD